ncbi:hypothetical protein [Bradyrhizobium lablabi]|uniref:hypothetical protein n=1 Tax=Bradyrhizobium lablabi TaxID=722472 RepID=UPI001BA8BF89|nr:hypothetical protein [Bradyrhizobium lablabi]MBR0693619.1 hypothetical protein [Bradyrhizobium lablabi]
MAKRGRPRKNQPEAPQASPGENISEDQLQALFFQSKTDYEKMLALKKKADADFKNCCKRIKAELGKRGVAEIKLAIGLGTEEGEAEAKADIESTMRIMAWMGVPVGTQADLFPAIDPAPITERAFNEGKRQGLAGETQKNPHHHATEAHRSHNDGYAAGQETLAKGIKPLDDTPTGSVPKDEWQRQLRENNDAVQQAIRDNAVDSLTAQ